MPKPTITLFSSPQEQEEYELKQMAALSPEQRMENYPSKYEFVRIYELRIHRL